MKERERERGRERAAVDANNCPCKSSYPLAGSGLSVLAVTQRLCLFVNTTKAAGGTANIPPNPSQENTTKYKIQKKMCMKRKKICLPLLHANCANPFKGKAVAALRAFHTNQCFYLSHSTVMSASLCASHTRARLNTQTADEATCLENNLKAQKVSKAARIGTS